MGLDKFKNTFIIEAKELAVKLEELLLEIEKNDDIEDTITGIFRVMHSLKGGSSMFGFNTLSDLTHNLETLFDIVRSNNELLNKDIIDIAFSSIDLINSLLVEEEDIDENVSENTNILNEKILNVINSNGLKKAEELKKEDSQISDKDIKETYYIQFKPEKNILKDGTNPLYIVSDLTLLGEAYIIVRTEDIPHITEIKQDLCYVWWEVILSTNSDINEIKDVFMFVENNATIKIEKLFDYDIYDFPGILDRIKDRARYHSPLDIENLDFTKVNEEENNQASNSPRRLVDKIKDLKTSKLKKNDDIDKKTEAISSIRVSSKKLDELMNIVSELVTTQARLHLYSENSDSPEIHTISEEITKITRQLRDNAFSVILIPIDSLLVKFKRLIRDLSTDLNKEINFITEGEETELDKSIIEVLNEPFLHLLRNCVDHGIESPEEREKAGKPRQGTIKLKAFYSGSNVHVQISDDGKGFNLDKIRQKAVVNGIIDANDNLSDKDILDMVFISGISTVSEVSDISGRGVGMDIVRKKIQDVRGEIEIDTTEGKGSTFTIKLPLTLSIIDGLLVKINNLNYLISLSVIDRIHKIAHSEFSRSYNDIVVINDVQFPYVYLRDFFGAEPTMQTEEHVIIVNSSEQLVGIVVDEVIGEYQAVLKPLGAHYKKVEIFSGGTILGDGTIALVLDTNKIIYETNK